MKMVLSFFNNPCSLIIDVGILSVIIVSYVRLIRAGSDQIEQRGVDDPERIDPRAEPGFFDVELFVRNTEVLITATSILLPGVLLGIDILKISTIPRINLFISSLWFLLSIIIGTLNIFRLPTVVNDKYVKKIREERLHIQDYPTLLFGLLQFLFLLMGSGRALLTFLMS